MSVGFSVKLPIQKDDNGSSYALNKSVKESIRQNLKMLILTAPGERIMDVNFGVGLRRWFFRPMTNTTFNEIATQVRDQIQKYMPFLEFGGIQFATREQDEILDHNQIRMQIYYTIPSIGTSDTLSLVERAALAL